MTNDKRSKRDQFYDSHPDYVGLAFNATAPPPHGRVIEMGWMNSKMQCDAVIFNPREIIPFAVTASCHITNEMAKDSGEDFSLILVPQARFHATHGVDNVRGFIGNGRKWICTEVVARQLWPGLDAFDAQFIRYYLDLELPQFQHDTDFWQPHRALCQAAIAAMIVEEATSEGWTLGDLHALTRKQSPGQRGRPARTEEPVLEGAV